MPGPHDHDLIKTLAFIVIIVFCIYGVRTFKYVGKQHSSYWPERRGPFLPAIDLLYNAYLLLAFLIRRDYKALQDPALDKLADNARLALIAVLFVILFAALD
jgi:hypothetical protein